MKKKHLLWIIPASILVILLTGFFIYTGIYYHADEVAFESLKSTENVEVTKKDFYYFFDSENEKDVVIFYPGAKVQTEAYAPLCMKLASEGVDVFLVDMPFHLAFLGLSRADKIISEYKYVNYYMSGHSLGGACAAKYAAKNKTMISGVFMLAAYTQDKLPDNFNNLLVHGSNDLVINKDNYYNNLKNAANAHEEIIEGGNHAGFAYYGNQKGDGELLITKEKQIEETVSLIINRIHLK